MLRGKKRKNKRKAPEIPSYVGRINDENKITRFFKMAKHAYEGEVAYDGNWGGQGWSDGQYMESNPDGDAPMISAMDYTSKPHDIDSALANNWQDLITADETFAKENIGRGLKRTAAGILVGLQGKKRKYMDQYLYPFRHHRYHPTRGKQTPYSRRQKRASFINLAKGETMKLRSGRDTEEDVDMGTSDAQPETSSAEARGAGVATGPKRGQETAITSFEGPTYGIAETQTVFHKYHDIFLVQLPETENAIRMVIRMNSIYDIIANQAASAAGGTDTVSVANSAARGDRILSTAPTITGDADGALHYINPSLNQPSYRTYYADKYRFYSVLGCDWQINLQGQALEDDRLQSAVFWHYHGSVEPPNRMKYKEMFYLKGLEGPEIIYCPSATYPYANTTIGGRYKTGKHHEVLDDDKATIWTNTDSTPTMHENLSIMFCRHPNTYNSIDKSLGPLEATPGEGTVLGYNQTLMIRAQLKMSYLVQWKDLKFKWRYWVDTPGTGPDTGVVNTEAAPIGDRS